MKSEVKKRDDIIITEREEQAKTVKRLNDENATLKNNSQEF
jgi:hypothetical protein